jgi:FkbM family methyltransferase
MAVLKEWARKTFAFMGYRITRLRVANRFQAMDETLLLLRGFGYAPKVIIDCGANMGTWTKMVDAIFPTADFHLIEPQAACAPVLEDLVRYKARMTFHHIAVTEPGLTHVRMIGGGKHSGGTGAWVARPDEAGPDEVKYPATTLDALLADRVVPGDRALLKLDLEGHEVYTLLGALRLLQAVEVILTEVQFYDINNSGRPVFADMVNFLRERGFELYDFACLSQRPRDMRLRMGDVIFVRRDSPLLTDRSWE